MLLPKTLLRSSEVKSLTNISDFIPTCTMQDIRSRELIEFRNCIGIGLYNLLLADLMDYSNTAKYDAATAYEVNDTVVYSDNPYICIQNSTGNTPANLEYWQPAPKFDNSDYNNLFYEGSLGRYLSFSVLQNTAPFWATQFKAQGLVLPAGDGYNAADSKAVERVLKAVGVNYADAYDNLQWWINENNLNSIFDSADKIIKSKCECGKSCGGSCLVNKRQRVSNSTWG